MADSTRTLYRPVGLKEMELILQADSRAFPPRLPEQPIFYPVLNFEYAEQIARDWNTKDPNSGYVGFVTKFDVDKAYLDRYEVQTVGSSRHQELWIHAEDLEDFNRHIQGRIQLTSAYYGKDYRGLKHHYRDWYADEILIGLFRAFEDPHALHGEMLADRNAILLNFRYWIQHGYSDHLSDEQKSELLWLIADTWQVKFPEIHLLDSELVLP